MIYYYDFRVIEELQSNNTDNANETELPTENFSKLLDSVITNMNRKQDGGTKKSNRLKCNTVTVDAAPDNKHQNANVKTSVDQPPKTVYKIIETESRKAVSTENEGATFVGDITEEDPSKKSMPTATDITANKDEGEHNFNDIELSSIGCSSEEDMFSSEIWGDNTISLFDSRDIIVKLVSKKLAKPITCPICDETFQNHSTFFSHKLIRLDCMLAVKKCEVCHETLPDNDTDRKQHIGNHLLPRNYYCDPCKRLECGSIIEQFEHLFHSKGIYYYICATCGKLFETNAEKWHHIYSNEMQGHCSAMARKNLVSLKDAIRMPVSDKTADKQMCEICGEIVNRIENHIQIHNPMRSYRCEICGNNFRTATYLYKHQQSHQKIPHKCELCGKVFFWNETYNKHMRQVHPTDSLFRFPCEYCQKKFQYKSVRDFHQSSHKSYKCKFCDKTIKYFKNLSEHYKKEHAPPKRIPKERCKYCNYFFVGIDDHYERCANAPNNATLSAENRSCSSAGIVPIEMPTQLRPTETENQMKALDRPEKKLILTKLKYRPSVANDKITKLNVNLKSSSDVKQLILKPITFSCKVCAKFFKTEAILVQHKIDVHQKKFRCKTCGLLADNIITHMKMHRLCLQCNIEFDTVTDLNQHQLQHSVAHITID